MAQPAQRGPAGTAHVFSGRRGDSMNGEVVHFPYDPMAYPVGPDTVEVVLRAPAPRCGRRAPGFHRQVHPLRPAAGGAHEADGFRRGPRLLRRPHVAAVRQVSVLFHPEDWGCRGLPRPARHFLQPRRKRAMELRLPLPVPLVAHQRPRSPARLGIRLHRLPGIRGALRQRRPVQRSARHRRLVRSSPHRLLRRRRPSGHHRPSRLHRRAGRELPVPDADIPVSK